MTVLEASMIANQSENQRRREQEAFPKDCESTVSGMSHSMCDRATCEAMLYTGVNYLARITRKFEMYKMT
jgi:hypothetical protein